VADQQTQTTTNQPGPEGQAQPQGSAPQANPAPVAGEEVAALKAQLDSLSKWKADAENDLKKYRDARKQTEAQAAAEKAELEKQLREQGKFAELAKQKEDEAKALAAQLAEVSGKASRLDAIEKTMFDRVAAAKAKGDLPSYIVKAIDIAPNPAAALDVLDDFRAEQAKHAGVPPAKQPAPPAPAMGAAPAAQPSAKKLDDMTPQEIHNLTPEQRAALFKPTSAARTAIKWF
jgi:hypothetical protein